MLVQSPKTRFQVGADGWRNLALIGVGALICFLITCSTPKSLITPKSGYALASWYGPKFHGRLTSSGEKFNMYDSTCAHRTLPFGTRIKIVNPRNNRSLLVRVNDRGPFVPGREFDLSYGAARELGCVVDGVVEIYYECLDIIPRSELEAEAYTIQVGSFSDIQNAQLMKQKLSEEFTPVRVSEYHAQEKHYFRVRVGFFASRAEAEKMENILAGRGFQTLVISVNN